MVQLGRALEGRSVSLAPKARRDETRLRKKKRFRRQTKKNKREKLSEPSPQVFDAKIMTREMRLRRGFMDGAYSIKKSETA